MRRSPRARNDQDDAFDQDPLNRLMIHIRQYKQLVERQLRTIDDFHSSVDRLYAIECRLEVLAKSSRDDPVGAFALTKNFEDKNRSTDTGLLEHGLSPPKMYQQLDESPGTTTMSDYVLHYILSKLKTQQEDSLDEVGATRMYLQRERKRLQNAASQCQSFLEYARIVDYDSCDREYMRKVTNPSLLRDHSLRLLRLHVENRVIPSPVVSTNYTRNTVNMEILNTQSRNEVKFEMVISNLFHENNFSLAIQVDLSSRAGWKLLTLNDRESLIDHKLCRKLWSHLGLSEETRPSETRGSFWESRAPPETRGSFWDFIMAILPVMVSTTILHHPKAQAWRNAFPGETHFFYTQWAQSEVANVCLPSKETRTIIGSYINRWDIDDGKEHHDDADDCAPIGKPKKIYRGAQRLTEIRALEASSSNEDESEQSESEESESEKSESEETPRPKPYTDQRKIKIAN